MSATGMKIGLAISGGGFRAMAFGLGAMRAMHDLDLLRAVTVVSGISGGAILSALWAYRGVDFDEWDLEIRRLLRGGLQLELARRAFSPGSLARSLGSTLSSAVERRPRAFSRTEALVSALRDRGLDMPMDAVAHAGLDVVLSATDLSTGNAVRFGSRVSSTSPFGRIRGSVPVAEAAAASAAFPLLLPALVRSFEFEESDGTLHVHRVAMTDGGVYDNLGITPLLPGRSIAHTSHVYDLDALVVVDAGRGRYDRRAAGQWFGRTKQTFEISHGRVQDAVRAQLHSLSGIKIVHVYLGSQDAKLPFVPDLMARDPIAAYPTNFAAMSSADLEALSVRAEQIGRALLAQHL